MSNIGNKQTIAKNLNYYIERSGKTQRELAEVVGVAPSTFNDWTKGKKYPRIDKIEILANYFGILKSDLIEEKSVQAMIEERPREMAEIHIEMIMDEDLPDIFADFKKLDAKQKKIIKNLIHDMAESEV